MVSLMGIENEIESGLNVAGYWTEGVAKGFFIAIVPIAVVTLAFGITVRIAKAGMKLGRIE